MKKFRKSLFGICVPIFGFNDFFGHICIALAAKSHPAVFHFTPFGFHVGERIWLSNQLSTVPTSHVRIRIVRIHEKRGFSVRTSLPVPSLPSMENHELIRKSEYAKEEGGKRNGSEDCHPLGNSNDEGKKQEEDAC
jgi:hypothetical protein